MTPNVKPVALFGGSFDPVHNGHIAVAKYVIEQGLVAEVIFTPVGVPWQKPQPLAAASDRKAMLELVVKDYPEFTVSSNELDRSGVSYTIDTVEELQAEDPTKKIYLLLGADAANGVTSWHRAAELITKVNFLVVARNQQESPELNFKFHFINMPMIDVSSSMIRNLVLSGNSVSHLVPHEVNSYILDHNLYKFSGVR